MRLPQGSPVALVPCPSVAIEYGSGASASAPRDELPWLLTCEQMDAVPTCPNSRFQPSAEVGGLS